MRKILLLVMMTMGLSLTAKENSFDKTVNKTQQGITTIYGDSKDIVKTVYGDLKDVAPKIESAVTEVAKGLKIGAENVWTILVRQQKVWSIAFLILTIISCINWYVFYKRNYYKIDNTDIEYETLERDIIGDILNPQYDKYYENRAGEIRGQMYIKGAVGKEQYHAPKIYEQSQSNFQIFIKFVHLCGCIILSYFSFKHFSDMLTGFINPEFSAMMQIFEIIKTIK